MLNYLSLDQVEYSLSVILYIQFNLRRQLTFLAIIRWRMLMYYSWMDRMQSYSLLLRLSQIKQLNPQVKADMALLNRLSTTLLIIFPNNNNISTKDTKCGNSLDVQIALIKIIMMNQQKLSLQKAIKSLSVRAFPKSARKPQLTGSRRNQTLPTQPLQLYSNTKKQFDLQAKTSRILTMQPKKPNYFKPTQQLQQENYKLKMKINDLNEVLGKQRSKKDHDKRNYSKVYQKLQAEFSDQKYFEYLTPKSDNVVEGVKYQYYKMKEKYEEKCRQYDQLFKRYNSTIIEEEKIFTDALQADNLKLKNKIATFINIQERLYDELASQQGYSSQNKSKRQTDKSSRQRQKKFNEVLNLSSQFTLLEKRANDAQQKSKRYEQKIVILKQTIKEKNKKISFLDRLITEKSNEVHHAILKQRKIAKQYKLQCQIGERLQKRIIQQEQLHKQQIDLIKEKQRIKFQTEKSIFVRSLKQKDTEIQKLKQQVYYLSTIISYIKVGQDPFKLQAVGSTFTNKKNSFKQHSEEFLQNLEKTLISIQGNFSNRKRVKTLIESGIKQYSPPKNNTQALKQIQVVSDVEDQGESRQGTPPLRSTMLQQGHIQSRMPKKSHLKHSEDSVKVRSIKPSQIEYFKKELVYRFMFYKLTIDQAKEYFSLSKQEESGLTKRQRKWRNQYATLKEIRSKLQAYPFQLKQEQALLLSRYIVEDCTKDNVYYHQENQIERNIAKSILRAFVGQYSIPHQENAKGEISQILEKYGRNLRSALQSLAPTGLISSIKFCQICQSIQVDFSDNARDFILSQLLSKSTVGLAQLEYALIFQGLA